MQLGGMRQVGAADGMARGPDHRHHLVGRGTRSCVLSLTILFCWLGAILAIAIIQRYVCQALDSRSLGSDRG